MRVVEDSEKQTPNYDDDTSRPNDSDDDDDNRRDDMYNCTCCVRHISDSSYVFAERRCEFYYQSRGTNSTPAVYRSGTIIRYVELVFSHFALDGSLSPLQQLARKCSARPIDAEAKFDRA